MKNAKDMITEDILNQAQQAFWEKLIEIFPQVQSGDFPPLESDKFDKDCKDAIETWLEWNHPDCEDCED